MDLQDFKQTILPIKDKLFRYAFRIVKDADEAQDVVQEVFIKLWNKRHEWDKYQNIEALCMRMTRNLAIDKTRSKHRRVQSLDTAYNVMENTASPERLTESNDTMSQIKSMIDGLPNKQKEIMQLRDIEGLSYKEIAAALKMPMSQVKVYLFRARKQIREQLVNSELYGLQ